MKKKPIVSKPIRVMLLIIALGLIPTVSTWPGSWFTAEIGTVPRSAIEYLFSLPFFQLVALVSIPVDIMLVTSLWLRWFGGEALLLRRIRPEKGLTGDESGLWTVFCRNCGRKLRWNKDEYCDRCRLPVTHQNMGIRVVKAHYFLSEHAFDRVRERVGSIGRLRETLRAGVRIEREPVEPNNNLIVTQTGVTCIVGVDNEIVTVRPTDHDDLKAVAEGTGHIVSLDAKVAWAPKRSRMWGLETWGSPEIPFLIFTMWLSSPALIPFLPILTSFFLPLWMGLACLLVVFALLVGADGIRNWMIWRRAKRDYRSQQVRVAA